MLPVEGKLLTLAVELLFGTQLLLLLGVEEELVLAAPLGAVCAASTFMLAPQPHRSQKRRAYKRQKTNLASITRYLNCTQDLYAIKKKICRFL